MTREKVFTVDGFEYRSLLFGAFESDELQATLQALLARAVAPALETGVKVLMAGGLSDLLDKDLDLSGLGGSLIALTTALTPRERAELNRRLLSQTRVTIKGRGLVELSDATVYDDHFAGRLEEMYLVVWEVITHNWPQKKISGFLRGLFPAASKSPEKPTSTSAEGSAGTSS